MVLLEVLLETTETGGGGLLVVKLCGLNLLLLLLGREEVLVGHGVEVVNLLLLLLSLVLLLLLLAESSSKLNLLLHGLELLLLLVQGMLLLNELGVVEVELLELLSRILHGHELLLEALLLLSKIKIGGQKLAVQVWVMLFRELRRRQDLVKSVLLVYRLVVVALRTIRVSRLRSVVSLVLAHAIGISSHGVPGILLLRTGRRRLRAERGSSSGLGSGPKTSKKVGTASARGGDTRVPVLGLADNINRERLGVLAATSSS